MGRKARCLSHFQRPIRFENAGKVEKKVADALAIKQFEQFKAEQRRIEAIEPTSDFDKFVDDIGKLNPPNESEGDDA